LKGSHLGHQQLFLLINTIFATNSPPKQLRACLSYPVDQSSRDFVVSSELDYRTDENLERCALDPLRFTKGGERMSIYVTIQVAPVNIALFLQAVNAVANE
jgi:hypothetical protein